MTVNTVIKKTIKKMKKESPILTNDLRQTLKSIMQNEINKLPEYLESLEPKERINIVLKLIPFVFPKVQSVHIKEGEPFSFD